MPTVAKPKVVWRGAASLKRYLVPVDELEPFPGNPRRGDVDAIRGSLKRFGQVRAMTVSAEDPRRMIAGHHFRLAAIEEGWTHIAVMPGEFKDDDEARAYMLADNRTHDLGHGYDTAALVEHLKMLAEIDALEGTGYTRDDLDERLAELRRRVDQPAPEPPVITPPLPPNELVEVVLMFSKAQRAQLEAWLQIVAKEKGTDGVSETVYAAARLAAETLNQA